MGRSGRLESWVGGCGERRRLALFVPTARHRTGARAFRGREGSRTGCGNYAENGGKSGPFRKTTSTPVGSLFPTSLRWSWISEQRDMVAIP